MLGFAVPRRPRSRTGVCRLAMQELQAGGVSRRLWSVFDAAPAGSSRSKFHQPMGGHFEAFTRFEIRSFDVPDLFGGVHLENLTFWPGRLTVFSISAALRSASSLFHPIEAATYGFFPGFEERFAGVLIHLGIPGAVNFPIGAEVSNVAVEAGGEARRVGRP